MNSLSDLNILPVMDTSTHDLSTEFFIPLLSNSIRYDRGVGYFSSGWLRINAKGMLDIANNGGRARWVTSPILDEDDWEALQTGYTARGDPTLRRALEHNITNLAKTLEYELLLRSRNPQSKVFLAEAIACYQAGEPYMLYM